MKSGMYYSYNLCVFATEFIIFIHRFDPQHVSFITCSCRKVFVFVQQTISMLAKRSPEMGVKLYLEAAKTANLLSSRDSESSFSPIAYELISQSFVLYEEHMGESKLQSRCIVSIVGTLLSIRCLSDDDYSSLIMKVTQYSAKMLKKSDQCEMVALCSHLFYVVDGEVSSMV
jgi:vacuolar protein sorting-associated protein 35